MPRSATAGYSTASAKRAGAPGIVLAGADLAELIGHSFARPELLAEALTHPSVLPQLHQGRRRQRRTKPPRNYERLEFLGDRVLGLVIADLSLPRFPAEPPGTAARHLAPRPLPQHPAPGP